ncbi:MAG: beta-galactosidase subunit alpha, partial [Chloroflexi bacterium]
AQDTNWAAAGHEIAWEQFNLPVSAPAPTPIATAGLPALKLAQNGALAHISGDDFSLTFDTAAGLITALDWRGQPVLHRGPALNLWRAPTDNDGFKFNITQPQKWLYQWLEAGLNELAPVEVETAVEQLSAQAVRLAAKIIYRAPGKPTVVTHTANTTVLAGGDLLIDNLVNAQLAANSLPRVGLHLQLPAGFEQFTWYGRGPHENYIDRNTGAALGLYRSTVDEQYVPYIMPQENGNKTGVRWLAVSNDTGLGLLAVAHPVLEASVSHYSAADLYRCYHTNELTRLEQTLLNLDMRQAGLGGASCGPGTRDDYWVPPGEHRFSVRLRPFLAGEENPAALARQRVEG